MERKHIYSVSFGKDSVAMLLLGIDKGLPIDEVVIFAGNMGGINGVTKPYFPTI